MGERQHEQKGSEHEVVHHDADAHAVDASTTKFKPGQVPPVHVGAQSHGAQPSPSEQAYGHGKPVSIDYIANTQDKVMALDRALAIDEIGGDNIPDMVNKILAKANGHLIKHLRIDGHGAPGWQSVGQHGQITDTMSKEDRAQLMRLRGHFTPGADVFLEGCNVAAGDEGESMIMQLARMWNVKVTGGTSYQRPTPGHEGTEMIAAPDGHGGAKLSMRGSDLTEFWRVDPSAIGKNPDKDWMKWATTAGPDSTMTDRYIAATMMLDGKTPPAAAAAVMHLFKISTLEERRRLYRQIEGHNWKGDFEHGMFVGDDSLWNNLSTPQVEELKNLLNG